DLPLWVGARLLGRVVTCDGTDPVPDARIALQWLMEPSQLRIEALGTAGADGWFSLPQPAACASATTLLVASAGEDVGAVAFDASRAGGTPFEIRLLPRAALRVHVVDGSGTPLRGAMLRLYPTSLPLGTLEPMIVAEGGTVSPFLQRHWQSVRSDDAGDAVFAPQPVASAITFHGRVQPAGAHVLEATCMWH